jgi:hypothetical protein
MAIRSVPQRDRVYASLIVLGLTLLMSLVLALIDPDNATFWFEPRAC